MQSLSIFISFLIFSIAATIVPSHSCYITLKCTRYLFGQPTLWN